MGWSCDVCRRDLLRVSFFQGGKGIAAALGIWLAIAPMVILFALGTFAVVVAISRITSLASIAAAIVLPLAVAILGLPHHYLLLAIVMSALALFRHRRTSSACPAGEEPKFQLKRKRRRRRALRTACGLIGRPSVKHPATRL